MDYDKLLAQVKEAQTSAAGDLTICFRALTSSYISLGFTKDQVVTKEVLLESLAQEILERLANPYRGFKHEDLIDEVEFIDCEEG